MRVYCYQQVSFYRGKNVESAPDAKDKRKVGVKFMRLRWKELYMQQYVPLAQEMGEKIVVDYNFFVKVRKQFRPYYQRHRKVRKIIVVYFDLLLCIYCFPPSVKIYFIRCKVACKMLCVFPHL